MRLLVVTFFFALACLSTAQNLNFIIGLHLTNEEDVEDADVFDGRSQNPINSKFSRNSCDCDDSKCKTDSCGHLCFLEAHHADSRHFYLQNAGSSAIMYRDPPVMEVTPLCHTDPTAVSLTATTNRGSTVNRIEPDTKARTLDIYFECKSLKAGAGGMFLVAINLEVSSAADKGKFSNVTWYLRKGCLATQATATGLSVTFTTNKVVDNGETTSNWQVSTSNARDVGYDPNDKDVYFTVLYKGGQSLTLNLTEPEYDESVIKSVKYKSDVINTKGGLTTLNSGSASSALIVRVTCQPHPVREAAPGEVTVGLTNMYRDGQALRDVMWKFQIECPFHGHKITPLGVLGIVLFMFLIIGCAGGYAYNINFTNRRGLLAIPLVPEIRDALRNARLASRNSSRYKRVATDDHDDMMHNHRDDNVVVEEEYLATVTSNQKPAYGSL